MSDDGREQALKTLTGLMDKMEESKMDPKDLLNTEVEFSTTEKILLPNGMSKKRAAKELLLQHEAEEKEVDKIHEFTTWAADDALVAIMRTLDREIGWINSKKRHTFFGTINPAEFNIKTGTGDNDYQQAFTGDFEIANWEDAKGTVGVDYDLGYAWIKITAKKKFAKRVESMFTQMESELKSNSIYKGKCIIWNGGTKFDFLDNNGIEEIILNPDADITLKVIEKQLKKRTGKKRGILFAGNYGTGKTETAMHLGRLGNTLGYTFIYCKKRDLATLLTVAKSYMPAIVFIEDMDEISSGDRGTNVNDLLNTFDGIETKGHDIVVIMTTNHPENINEAFRRPGRIDVVMNFNLPEKSTVKRLYQSLYQDVQGGSSLDYDAIAEATPDVQQAMIVEIATRAIDLKDDVGPLTTEDVIQSIVLAQNQVEFMQGKREEVRTNVATELDALITEKVESSKTLAEMKELLSKINDNM